MKAVVQFFSLIFGIAALVVFIMGLVSQETTVLILSVFLAWGVALLSALSMKNKNVIHIFFLFTFFVFLLSRVMVRWLDSGEIYMPFPQEVMTTVYTCLFLSLFGLTIGAALPIIRLSPQRQSPLEQRKLDMAKEEERQKKEGEARELLRVPAAIFTILCGVAALLLVLEQAAFWRVSGYGGDLRTAFKSSLPTIIVRISHVYTLMLCIYLATLPKKRRCMPILLQYLAVSALKMFYGSRMDFTVGLMFLLVYFVMRDQMNKDLKTDPSEKPPTKWFGKGELIFTLVSIPLLIVLLVFVGNYRTHTSFSFSGFGDSFKEFFEKQGTSIDFIGYTKIHKAQITQPHFLFLFDRTYEFLTTNPLASFLTGRHSYAANTEARALYGSSLGMTLYYYVNRTSYLLGNGGGSSYVAEAWIGYGYVGVFFVNVLLAKIMSWLSRFRFRRLAPSVFVLLYLQSLFFMPRGGFDTFVGDFASMTHLIAVFLLWIAYRAAADKKRSLAGKTQGVVRTGN